jgi:hypothetical protein
MTEFPPLYINVTEQELNAALQIPELAPVAQGIIDNCNRLLEEWKRRPEERDPDFEQIIREDLAVATARVREGVKDIVSSSIFI